MKWSKSTQKELYFTYEPIHAFIERDNRGDEPQWALTSGILGLRGAPLHTMDLQEAIVAANQMLARKASAMLDALNQLIAECPSASLET